jgi:hypothetical protein
VFSFDYPNLFIKFLNLLLSLSHFLPQFLNVIHLILNLILCSLQLCGQFENFLLFNLNLFCLTFEFPFHLRELFREFLFLILQHNNLLLDYYLLSLYISFDFFEVSSLQHKLPLFLFQMCLLNWNLIYLLLEISYHLANLTHFFVQLLELW